MVVLGIDPGTIVAGYSIITYHARSLSVVDAGICKLPSKDPMPVRIHALYTFFTDLITRHNVTCIALETPFLGKNVQTAIKLGQVRGVLYLLSQMHGCALYELSPAELKRAITGHGGADKEQVARVIQRLFPSLHTIERFDMTDAIAVGLCGAWAHKTPTPAVPV